MNDKIVSELVNQAELPKNLLDEREANKQQLEDLLDKFTKLGNSPDDSTNQTFQTQAILQAQEKLAKIEALRSEMLADIEEIAILVILLQKKVAQHIKSDQNPDGPLKFAQQDYQKCFTVDIDSFRGLLEQDVVLSKQRLQQTHDITQKIAKDSAKFFVDQ